MAVEYALEAVRKTGDKPVPLHLRNGVTGFMKNIGYGKNYQYDHHSDQQFAGQEFLPEGLEETTFYQPGENAREHEVRKFLKDRWKEKYGY